FARRTHVNQRFASVALSERFIEECANLLVEAFLRHRITGLCVFWNLTRHRAAFRLPFVASAVENFHFLVAKQLERPKRVAGPPVRFIAVEDTGRIWRNAVTAAKPREFFR